MSKRSRTITRRIYFYRLAEKAELLPLLPNELQRIANLPYNEHGRYLADGDEGRLIVWPDTIEYPLRIRFGRTRMANLPTKERAGKLESLDLAVDQGLAELCHLVIYEDGYVAAEFNFDGPRVTRLGEYLYAKRHKLKTKPKFLPLFQSDVLSLVRGLPVVNLLELKGVPRAASLLAKADQHLGQAYATIGDVGANKSIQLIMAGENYPESRLKNLALRLAGLSRHHDRDVRYDMTRLRVRGFTADGRIDEVDLLEDHLIAVKTFERQDAKGKAISSDSAYEQIDAAYSERRDELDEAVEGRKFR